MDDQARNMLTLYLSAAGVLTGLLGFLRSWAQDWLRGHDENVREDERQKMRITALEKHEHEREQEAGG